MDIGAAARSPASRSGAASTTRTSWERAALARRIALGTPVPQAARHGTAQVWKSALPVCHSGIRMSVSQTLSAACTTTGGCPSSSRWTGFGFCRRSGLGDGRFHRASTRAQRPSRAAGSAGYATQRQLPTSPCRYCRREGFTSLPHHGSRRPLERNRHESRDVDRVDHLPGRPGRAGRPWQADLLSAMKLQQRRQGGDRAYRGSRQDQRR